MANPDIVGGWDRTIRATTKAELERGVAKEQKTSTGEEQSTRPTTKAEERRGVARTAKRKTTRGSRKKSTSVADTTNKAPGMTKSTAKTVSTTTRSPR